jgi:hypothetical protein
MTDEEISLRLKAIERRHQMLESVEQQLEHELELVDSRPPSDDAEAAATVSVACRLMFLQGDHLATIEREVPGQIGRLLAEEARLLCRYHRLMAATEIRKDREFWKISQYVTRVCRMISRRAESTRLRASKAIAPGFTPFLEPDLPSFLKTGS